jgi:4-hydroxy-tetrahydrodipicolinate synthase
LPKLKLVANVVTPFAADGSLDEAALAAHARRVSQTGCGLFVGSPGTGEVHTLSLSEYSRLCSVAVSSVGNDGFVAAMTPETYRLDDMLVFCRAAADAGVDEVQMWQYMGGHGMLPTVAEQREYWRRALSSVDFPVCLSLHRYAGYLCPPDLLGQLCAEFPIIRTVYTYGASQREVLAIRAAVPSAVSLGGDLARGFSEVALGVNTLNTIYANVAPRTCKAVVDAYLSNDFMSALKFMRRLVDLGEVIARWGNPNFRALKMALAVLDLPGGKSTVRWPIEYPPEAEKFRMAEMLRELGVMQWESELEGLV